MRFTERIPKLGLEIIERRWIRDIKTGLYLLSPGKGHHSTSDWDFLESVAANSWALNTSEYVSSPSSVKLTATASVGVYSTAMMACNLAAAKGLLEGRVVTQLYMHTLPTQGSVDYFAMFGCTGETINDYQSKTLNAQVGNWKRSRVTWWNSYDLNNNAKLAVRMDYMSAGDWVIGAIEYQNRLSGTTIQCGIGIWRYYSSTEFNCSFDDTAIWG